MSSIVNPWNVSEKVLTMNHTSTSSFQICIWGCLDQPGIERVLRFIICLGCAFFLEYLSNSKKNRHPQRFHARYVYVHLVDLYGLHVGKYTSPMDPMGSQVMQPLRRASRALLGSSLCLSVAFVSFYVVSLGPQNHEKWGCGFPQYIWFISYNP